MALLFLRHGSTGANAGDEDPRYGFGQQDYFRGWSNIPLSPRGEKSVQHSADWLRRIPIGQIVTSDLPRAQQTAQAVSQATGTPATVDPRLRPLNVGQLSGQPITPALKAVMDKAHSDRDFVIPGGESYNQFIQRYSGILPDLVNAAKNQNILVVTHHRNILALPHVFFGKNPQSEGPPAPGGIVALTQKGLQTIFEPSAEHVEAYKKEAVS